MGTHVYTAGSATTIERTDRWAQRVIFMHDFEFQTAVTYDDQRLIITHDCTLKQIHAEFLTAPTGCDAIFNIKKKGVEQLAGGDRPTLTVSTTTLTETGLSIAFEAGDYLEWVDVQKGSGTAGGFGAIVLIFE